MGRLHGLVRDPDQVGRDHPEVDLAAQAGAERLDDADGVVAPAVEALVDQVLDLASGGLEQRGHGQGGGRHLADAWGAERLAGRAEDELRASGARPRRRAVTGPGAMTASEERVARMAARGMTNREIAQSLFVTAKTVENQLGSAYRKLGVRSRDELGRVLASTQLA